MARVPDVPCARCGKLLYGGKGSLPAGKRTCRDCRRDATDRKPKRWKFCAEPECESLARSFERCDKHRPPVSTDTDCTSTGCHRRSDARGLCKPHYKQWARQHGMIKDTWNDTRRNRYHQKRTNSPRRGDAVMLAKIIERDGSECAWCGEPIDLSLTWPHRMYRTIDHIVPVSLGGEHSMDNTRLMHFACNSSRGNRVNLDAPEAA